MELSAGHHAASLEGLKDAAKNVAALIFALTICSRSFILSSYNGSSFTF